MKKRYNFTFHARKRFRDRFGKLLENDDVVLSLFRQINIATPDNSVRNNTRFMTYVYETYGYEKKFDFLVNDDIVFVCEGNNLITVYPRRDSKFDTSSSRFRKC